MREAAKLDRPVLIEVPVGPMPRPLLWGAPTSREVPAARGVPVPMSTRIVLGTATPGGGFPVYGDAVAAVINAVDDSLRVETRNTKGSTEMTRHMALHPHIGTTD